MSTLKSQLDQANKEIDDLFAQQEKYIGKIEEIRQEAKTNFDFLSSDISQLNHELNKVKSSEDQTDTNNSSKQ